MENFQRFYFQGAGCTLSAVDFGRRDTTPEDRPSLVLVHGMRDHGLSMLRIAASLHDRFQVISMDLRGHGHSDNPGVYSMAHFVADLQALITHCKLDQVHLIGHSLGGHIVSRYSSTFPDKVVSLILLDGMGPPSAKRLPTLLESAERYQQELQGLLNQTIERRQITDKSEAVQRLLRNNPRLSTEFATTIVDEGVEDHPEGGVRWRWDPAVNMVWQTFSQTEAESLLGLIDCPVLLVTGDEGLNYWTSMRPGLDDQAWYEAELVRRTGLFKQARQELIHEAGHMLHYDQPEALNGLLDDFLNPTFRRLFNSG